MTTAKERAKRALRHAPFLGLGKEAVRPLVEQEIIEAQREERDLVAAFIGNQYQCNCSPEWTGRDMHAPDCFWAEADYLITAIRHLDQGAE